MREISNQAAAGKRRFPMEGWDHRQSAIKIDDPRFNALHNNDSLQRKARGTFKRDDSFYNKFS